MCATIPDADVHHCVTPRSEALRRLETSLLEDNADLRRSQETTQSAERGLQEEVQRQQQLVSGLRERERDLEAIRVELNERVVS